MSEVNESEDLFDDKPIISYEDICDEKDSRPQHLDSFFEEVRLWQSEHSDTVFPSHQEASLRMEQVVERFERQALAKGMLGRIAILRGVGVQAPHAQYDEVTAQFVMRPMPIEELRKDVSMAAEVNGARGNFAGFGYRLIPRNQGVETYYGTNDDDSPGTDQYSGSLLYQIASRFYSHAQGATQGFVTGRVLDTHLEFVDDIKKQQLDMTMEGLLTIGSLKTAQQIEELHGLLLGKDGWETKLPGIVGLTSKIAGSSDFKDDQVKQDLLIDLLSHYIDPQGTYTMAAQDAILLVNGKKVSRVRTDEEPIAVSRQKISGIVLDNAYRRNKGRFVMSQTRHVPYFVVETPAEVLYIAMDRLLKFQISE